MSQIDVLVLVAYFLLVIGIGVVCFFRIKAQEDYFMGGRRFGRLLQTFAAFGAGTGSSDPVNVAGRTFTEGLSGMWSVMFWLFVTPFYWFTAVWYRRMRHLTLGDWYAERYDSKSLGAAYALFGILFYFFWCSVMISAVGGRLSIRCTVRTLPAWLGWYSGAVRIATGAPARRTWKTSGPSRSATW